MPVTVTVYTPADPLQERPEVPDPVTLAVVRVHAWPVVGLMLDAKLTTAPKPPCAVMAMVDVPAVPAFTVTSVGLAEIVKSWTSYITVAV